MIKTTSDLDTQAISAEAEGIVYRAEEDILVTNQMGNTKKIEAGEWFLCEGELTSINSQETYKAWDQGLVSIGTELLPMSDIQRALPNASVEAMAKGPRFVLNNRRPFNRSVDGVRKAAVWLATCRLHDDPGRRSRR